MIVSNTINSLHPTIYLTDAKTVNEFILKENEHYVRNPIIKKNMGEFFFFENGAAGIISRSKFAEFFNYQNINKQVPKIQSLLIKRFGELKANWSQPSDA